MVVVAVLLLLRLENMTCPNGKMANMGRWESREILDGVFRSIGGRHILAD